MQLYNKLSNEERATIIKKANEKRLTLSFYKYHRIKDVEVFRYYLFTNFNNLSILCRIYVSSEGINSQLSIPSKKMEELKNFLDSIYFLKDVRLNVGIEHHNESFQKLKIKIKDKVFNSDELVSILTKSSKEHLIGDVNVGLAVSSGLDSLSLLSLLKNTPIE